MKKHLSTLLIFLLTLAAYGQTSPSFSNFSGPKSPASSPSPQAAPLPTCTGSSSPVTLTQSTAQTIAPFNSIACISGGIHTDNSYWRAFTISNAYSLTVSAVEIGVETAQSSSGSQPITVTIYQNTGGSFPAGTRTQVGTTNFSVTNQSSTIISVPITASLPAGSEMVVEIFIPNGIPVGNRFFIGSNAVGQSGPSYISATDCGVTTPTPLSSLGFPNVHIVMNVLGCSTPCTAPIAYNVTGGGNYCAGGSGVPIGLDDSETGVNYQLKNGITDVGTPVAGTDNAITFGLQTALGTYTVKATRTAGGCTTTMTGTAVVTANDTQPPTIECPANITVCEGSVVTFTPPVGTDNCPGATTLQTTGLPSGSVYPVGTTTNTFQVTAANGQTATCSFTVTVNPKPTATVSGTATVCQNTSASLVTFTGNGGTPPYQFTYKINGGANQIVTTVSGNSVTVSQPTANVGAFIYSLISVSDANCGQNQSGSTTVTINSVHLINLTSAAATESQIGCAGTPITPITYALSGGATGAGVSGLPAGVTSSVAAGVLTISGIPSVSGTFNYSITTTGNVCATANESGTLILNSKPVITLSVNGQTFNEGNSSVLCDTDANPTNTLTPTVTTGCLSGPVLWRVQIGASVWSDWTSTAPSSQPSNNTAYRYQAACGGNCPSTFTESIVLTINYRASIPQNVSLVADGTTVAVGESKSICDVAGSAITFNATCAAGEIVLYSVDGGDYSSTLLSQIVDGNFHNYRVRCRKADNTISCVETESGVMSLKITTVPAIPTATISPLSACETTLPFSGNSTCAANATLWYNAANDQLLPSLPATTPNATTSFYARCSNAAGCLSEKSNTVTFTFTPVNNPPVITVSSEAVCTGTPVTVSSNCPAGSTTIWNTGVTQSSFQVTFTNVSHQSYSAKCVFPNGCQSPVSALKEVIWKAFDLTVINIGQSQSGIKPANDRNLWSSQFITPDAGPSLEKSSQLSPTMYYTENLNKGAPRYWTIQVETCNLGTDGSVTYDMLATPELGMPQSFNTHENNAPYLMYANREGWTELYAQNHPAYGFYQSNGSGGNTYDAGLPKGLYKLGIRYWDQKGQGSIYPSTRQPAGNVLAYQEYWFRIQSKNGPNTGGARVGSESIDSSFAQVAPNPVSQTLHLKINEAKGQKVSTGLADASGRKILQRSFVPQTDQHQEEFEVSHLANGIYFLQIKTDSKQMTLKVVKVQ